MSLIIKFSFNKELKLLLLSHEFSLMTSLVWVLAPSYI